jgi:hypothetical protein
MALDSELLKVMIAVLRGELPAYGAVEQAERRVGR